MTYTNIPISDDRIRETLAEISGVRRRAQKLGNVSFHPFPARMPLAVAEFLVESLCAPGGVVLDPMVGSGTSLIAAQRAGRIGIGFDLDPLAVILSRASILTADPGVLQMAHHRVFAEATQRLRRLRRPPHQAAQGFSEAEIEFIDYWFPRRSQRELFALASAIKAEQEPAVREFLWAVLSSVVISKSGGASYALDLAHSRPHRYLNKKVQWPLESWTPRFQRALRRTVSRVGSADGLGVAKANLGDARKLDMQDSTVDFVLTSPPYLQAIDYIRAHKFALVWMGYDLTKLRQLRSALIGTTCGLVSPDGLPVSIEASLTRRVKQPTRRGLIRRYLSDIKAVMAEARRVLKPGGVAVFAVGPSVMFRSRHDVIDVLEELGSAVGLRVVCAVSRRLNSLRRALPPPRRVSSDNSLNKRMRTEVFLAIRKDESDKL